LPMYPQLRAEQQSRVVDEILQFASCAVVSKRAEGEVGAMATADRTA